MSPEISRGLLKNTKSESDIIYNIGGGMGDRLRIMGNTKVLMLWK